MKYCLIEHVEKDYQLPPNCIYEALTQEAVNYLDIMNVSYITFEDFYTSGGIRGDTNKYLINQLECFDVMASLIKEYKELHK